MFNQGDWKPPYFQFMYNYFYKEDMKKRKKNQTGLQSVFFSSRRVSSALSLHTFLLSASSVRLMTDKSTYLPTLSPCHCHAMPGYTIRYKKNFSSLYVVFFIYSLRKAYFSKHNSLEFYVILSKSNDAYNLNSIDD